MRVLVLAVVALAVLAGAGQAAMVSVEVVGEVEFNLIHSGPFAVVSTGDPVTISFIVDSDNYLNSSNYPTRGYAIDQSSFSAAIGSVTVGFPQPFPGGDTPYFVLRDNDPAVDGFFISVNVDWPSGLPVDVPAQLDPYFYSQFDVGYDGNTLSSLDILDAIGTYDYTGLTNFYFGLTDGGMDAMGMIFTQMTIASASVPVEETSWSRVKSMFR